MAPNPLGTEFAPSPQITCTLTGFVNGDTQRDATLGQPRLTTTATSKSAPGAYPIDVTAGGLFAYRYTFVFVDGTLTIAK